MFKVVSSMWRVLQSRVPYTRRHCWLCFLLSDAFVLRHRSGKNSWKGKYSRKVSLEKLPWLMMAAGSLDLFRFMFHNWPCAVPSSYSMITYITAVLGDLKASANCQLLLRDAMPWDGKKHFNFSLPFATAAACFYIFYMKVKLQFIFLSFLSFDLLTIQGLVQRHFVKVKGYKKNFFTLQTLTYFLRLCRMKNGDMEILESSQRNTF